MTVTKKAKKSRENFPIIGMGGSAGSFNAFERFFLHMPVTSGMAFVIVMHLDPNHNMNVSGLLQKCTSMPIIEAEDGMEMLPDHVYVIPPDRDMGLHNRKLLLFSASRTKGARMTIDYFFQSLAEDQWNQAVGIVFSGMGADGETGVRMLKEKLGMVMVQTPESAEFDSMPLASIKTKMVDYVLEPEEMPVRLIQYLNHPAMRDPMPEEFISERNNQSHIQKILMLLRSHTGHDFSLYKKSTIIRRIERRIAFHQLPDYVHYVNYLRENPQETEVLFHDLLIGVTKFFRDRTAFDILRDRLYPALAKKNPSDPIRIWIAGCSTGEEAYSVAILILEYLESLNLKKGPKVQIFATDLDAEAIETARAGFYFSNIVSEISLERIEKYFDKKNNGFVVKKEVREIIVFAQHNLIKDAPFTRLDMLSCRNVMIYLTAELQKKLISIFHYSLNVNGILFLGPAESLGSFSDSFNNLDPKWKIFERKDGVSIFGKLIDFPFNISSHTFKPHAYDPKLKISSKNPISDTLNKKLLENYTPPSVLLTEKGEIIYVNGQVGKYIQFNTGEAALNVHRLVREEIKYALGNAIFEAWEQKKLVEISNLKLKENGAVHLVTIVVEYLNENILEELLLVTFHDKGVQKKAKLNSKSPNGIKESEVEELEKELIYTKQQLHTTIEQMETSLEELKSTNEELQSTNEELQSTNEEALTTKEEMQSLNEELMTINLQYQNKAEELTQLNNDMKNLLDNTEIGTIFLDNQLNILRFTPQVTKLFNVIPADIGRSITHIASNFDYPAIENAVMEVIERLTGKELEVCTKKDEWYNLRIMPYRTIDNFISGAVLTFTKITPVKAMEVKLKALMKYAQSIIDAYPDAAVILDKNLHLLVVNQAFLKLFHLFESELIEKSFLEIAHNKWQTNKFDALLLNKNALKEIRIQQDFENERMNILVSIEHVKMKDSKTESVTIMIFKNQQSERNK